MWRQIQEIAGLEHELLLGDEMAQDLQRCALVERCVVAPRDSPATPALGLQEEHVIAVDVRTDAAAVGCPRDHEIVEPCVGHEAK